jgi:hypothetical protein
MERFTAGHVIAGFPEWEAFFTAGIIQIEIVVPKC